MPDRTPSLSRWLQDQHGRQIPAGTPQNRQRISNWIREVQGRRSDDPYTSRLNNDTQVDAASVVSNWEYLLRALRSRAPGMYSQNVQALSQHFTSGVYLALNTMCKQAAQAEWRIFEEIGSPHEPDVELQKHEPVVKLFKNPNNEDDFVDILAQLTQQIGLNGIALEWIPVWGNQIQPEEMYIIPTATALPWPPSPVYPHGSYLIQPFYPFGPFSTIPSYQSAAGARIPAEQIIRIKNDHPILRYDGYATLTAIQRHVDTVEAIDTARWSTQQLGLDPSIIISFDPKLVNPDKADFKRIRTELQAIYAGPVNAGKIMFNPFGGKADKLSHTPNEMAWEKGWEQLMAFEQACFGVPKGISGMDDDTSFATLYARMKQFNLLSLDPLLDKLGRKNTKRLIKPYFGGDLYLKLTARKITDEEMVLKKIGVGIQSKTLRLNEIRKLLDLDLPPIDGPQGDEFIGQHEEELQMQQMQMQQQHERQQAKEAQHVGPGRSEYNAARREADSGRQRNPQGLGALGPRKSLVTADRMAEVLDEMKHKGAAVPVEDYNDGAAEYLRQRANGKY